MKVYVLSLLNSPRRLSCDNHLKDVDYDFFDAIDGSEAKNYNVSKDWVDPYNRRAMTLGEVGCALSHCEIWKTFLNESEEELLCVLEDDVLLLNDWYTIKSRIHISFENNNIEFLYLGRKKMGNMIEYELQKGLLQPSFSYWTSSYVVNRCGARKLYSGGHIVNHLVPVDEYIPYMMNLFYHPDATLKVLDASFSSIRDETGVLLAGALEPAVASQTVLFSSDTFHSESAVLSHAGVHLVTVATERTDTYCRYVKSCETYGISPTVLGMGHAWKGGDIANGPGGGQKVNLLREHIFTLQNKEELLIFTDCYDVIMNNNIMHAVHEYRSKFDGKIVFGSESICWPDISLEKKYPKMKVRNCFLNSGGFMGTIGKIQGLLERDIHDEEDDQLYYTKLFLSGEYDIVLDYNCDIFICLNGSAFTLDDSRSCLFSSSNNRPVFIHGNGPPYIKRKLDNISNLSCVGWNSTYGYPIAKKSDSLPSVTVIFEELCQPSEECISSIVNLEIKSYSSFVYIYETKPCLKIVERYADNIIMLKRLPETFKYCISRIDSRTVFYISSFAVIEKNTLSYLYSRDANVISPLLVRRNTTFSNVWLDLTEGGWYKSHTNYNSVIMRIKKSMWSAQYIWHCVLFKNNSLDINILEGRGDIDMLVCKNLKNKNYILYLDNTREYGYLDDKPVTLLSFKDDTSKWEKKYITPEFLISKDTRVEIFRDVWKIPMFTKKFCEEIINVANNNGNWSNGGTSHYDKRIGAKENHPTQDIHLKQIGLEDMWKFILNNYIATIVWNEYNYHTNSLNIAFIARYSIHGQHALRPHHDSSSYTVNVCLNNKFEGGGCHFLRRDELVEHKDIGNLIIHPGRMTHYHQGLPITSGMRYVLVAFID